MYKKTLGINKNELLNLSDEDLAKKLSIIIPSNKNGSIGQMKQDDDSNKTKKKK